MTRASDTAATRAALLVGARAVITENGIAKASIDEIARRAGVTKGAFYYAFASKADLLVELAQSLSVVIVSDDVDVNSFNPVEVAEAMLRAAGEARENLVLQLELWLYASRDPKMRERLADILQRSRAELETKLTDLPQPSQASLVTRSIMSGLMLQLLVDDSISAEDIAGVLATVLLALRNA